ncbi:hypothetical protein ACAW74_25735 [Fibrella sp. WM1]|uniref:hypothetical protein n=1 Tax=Fibrella musci TaxID=3242485 RepID=UPI00351FC5C7
MSQLTAKDKKALAEYHSAALVIQTAQPGADPKESTADRQKRIAMLLAPGNFEAFCWYYCPNYMTDRKTKKRVRFGWFHNKAAELIINDPDIFAALEWPRGHAKSVFANVFIVLYLLAKGELDGVIVASQNEKKATQLLIDIQVQLEGNAKFIADFGEQKTHGDWAEGSFSTKAGIGFWAYGRGQSPRGTRKGERRPNLIICDDIDDKEICKNQERVEEAVAWVREDLMGCFDGTQGRFLLVGNRIHQASILAHLVGDVEEDDPVNPAVTRVKVYALEDPKTHAEDQSEEGKPAWPSRFTRKKLEKQFEKIGYRSAQREYFHKHIVEGKVFKRDWLFYAPMPDLSVYQSIVVYVDPSFKATKKSDFKAIVAVGKVGKYYDILDLWVRQATRTAMVQAHYDMDARLKEKGAKLIDHWMEANFLQDLIMEDYTEHSITAGFMLPVREDKRDKPDKYARIEGTSPLFERKVVRINEALKRDPDHRAFTDQLLNFPTGHDDGPDAWEGAVFKTNEKNRTSAGAVYGSYRRNTRY